MSDGLNPFRNLYSKTRTRAGGLWKLAGKAAVQDITADTLHRIFFKEDSECVDKPVLPHRACNVMTFLAVSSISGVFVSDESRGNFGEHLQSVRQAEDNAVSLDPKMSDTKTTRFLQLVLNRLDDTSVVVFCATKQRCNDLALLLGGLEGHTVSCFTLKKKKDGDVCKFLESDRGVLFIDLSTSSAGLTLVTSNVLIFFDDPGTAAQREQAEAGVRRTGQTRPVEIFSFEEA